MIILVLFKMYIKYITSKMRFYKLPAARFECSKKEKCEKYTKKLKKISNISENFGLSQALT